MVVAVLSGSTRETRATSAGHRPPGRRTAELAQRREEESNRRANTRRERHSGDESAGAIADSTRWLIRCVIATGVLARGSVPWALEEQSMQRCTSKRGATCSTAGWCVSCWGDLAQCTARAERQSFKLGRRPARSRLDTRRRLSWCVCVARQSLPAGAGVASCPVVASAGGHARRDGRHRPTTPTRMGCAHRTAGQRRSEGGTESIQRDACCWLSSRCRRSDARRRLPATPLERR